MRPFPSTTEMTLENAVAPLRDTGSYKQLVVAANTLQIDLVRIQPHSVGPEPVETVFRGDSGAYSRVDTRQVATVKGYDKDGNSYYIRFVIPETDKKDFIHWLMNYEKR